MDKEELDLEGELKVWADLCKGKGGSGIKGKCCFCGKEFLGYGHDPRPIKVEGEEMPRCCGECNSRIVAATREVVWGAEAEKDREIKALKAEIEAECQEHIEAMLVADKTIRMLAKALELACEKVGCAGCPLTKKCGNCYGVAECCEVELPKYFKEQARKELENE